MPGPSNFWGTVVATSVNIPTSAETAVVVSNSVEVDSIQRAVTLSGVVSVTPGTSTSAVTLRIRRGNGITGTVVGTIGPFFVVAAEDIVCPYDATDTPGESAGLVYTVSVISTGAGAAGTAQVATVTAITAGK